MLNSMTSVRGRFFLVATSIMLLLATHAAGAQQSALPLPLGTVRPSAPPAHCVHGFNCSGVRVTCPGVREDVDAYLATGNPKGTVLGVVAVFSSGPGDEPWSNQSEMGRDFLSHLRDGGLRVVQVWWKTPWLRSASGEQAGPSRLACRSATIMRWIHDRNPIRSRPGKPCGFCVTGSSAGASQISYALAFYGLDGLVDVAAPTSGPPHAGLATGCETRGHDAAYSPRNRTVIDESFGFLDGSGPCATRDPTWHERWMDESVENNGKYRYPSTAIRFVFGSDDPAALYHGRLYLDALRRAGSPDVKTAVIEGMPHNIQLSVPGLSALSAALLGDRPFPEGTLAAVPSSETPTPNAQRSRGRSPLAAPTGKRTARPMNLWIVGAIVAIALAAAAGYELGRRGDHSPTSPAEDSSPDRIDEP